MAPSPPNFGDRLVRSPFDGELVPAAAVPAVGVVHGPAHDDDLEYPDVVVTDPGGEHDIVVDGGAVKSLWPQGWTDFKPYQADPRLRFIAANDSNIAAYGCVDVDVTWKEAPRVFRHRFIVADVPEALFGRDFCNTYNVVIFHGSNRIAVD